jgi:hypothetical protein
MKLMMMIYEDAREAARRDDPAQAPAYWGAWTAYVQALGAAGLIASGNGLQPPATATTLRLRDGARLVQDGPFADSKEQLGGYFILEVPDLETALDWAARCPAAAAGGIELRPVLPPMA